MNETIYGRALRLMEDANDKNKYDDAELYGSIVDAVDAMRDPQEDRIKRCLRRLLG